MGREFASISSFAVRSTEDSAIEIEHCSFAGIVSKRTISPEKIKDLFGCGGDAKFHCWVCGDSPELRRRELRGFVRIF